MTRSLEGIEMDVLFRAVQRGGCAYATATEPIKFGRGQVGDQFDPYWNEPAHGGKAFWNDDGRIHMAIAGDTVLITEVMPRENSPLLLYPYEHDTLLCYRAVVVYNSASLRDIRFTYHTTKRVYEYVMRRARILEF